jgi:hypothetical protein
VQTERSEIEPDRRRRLVEAAAAVGLDLGMPARQLRLHHRGLVHREALETAFGRGQRDDQRTLARLPAPLAGRPRQGRGQSAPIELQAANARGDSSEPAARRR